MIDKISTLKIMVAMEVKKEYFSNYFLTMEIRHEKISPTKKDFCRDDFKSIIDYLHYILSIYLVKISAFFYYDWERKHLACKHILLQAAVAFRSLK